MSIRRRPDGSYTIRYYPGGRATRIGPDGSTVELWQRQETLRGVSFKEARRIYRQKIGKEAGRRASADHRVTFRQLAALYIEKPDMADSSRERHRGILDNHVLPALGDRTIESLGPLDVETYQKKRLAVVTASTVDREVVVIRAVLNYGDSKNLIDRNPIKRGSVPKLSSENGAVSEGDEDDDGVEVLYFELEEWRRFIAAFDDDEAWARHVRRIRNLGPVKIGAASPEARRYGAGRRPDSAATAAYRERLRGMVPIFRALLYTGSRLDEILSLKRGALKVPGKVTIRQSKTRKAPNGRFKMIPLSEGLREVIASLPARVSGYVFSRPDGGRYEKREVQRAFDVAKAVSGIRKELHPHSLRHTFASWLAMAGVPLHTISRLLGHADIRMTERYAHLSPAYLQDAAELVGSIEKSEFSAPALGPKVGLAG